jgi:hypothetical protein
MESPRPADASDLELDARRTALDEVLSSRTFSRADQLKRFLSFVCEMELSGRGSDISEYTIATEALGRPPSYAPLEDSTVRTTARTVRQKLALFYESERPDARLRIEIPKGMYAPQFVEWRPERALPAPAAWRLAKWQFAVITGAALCLGAWTAIGVERIWRSAPEPVSSVIQEAWAPVAAPGATVLLCVSTPVQMMVRSLPDPAPPPGAFALPPEFDTFRQSFTNLQGRSEAPYLFLEPSAISTTIGEAFAAVRAAQVLQSLGREFKPMATRTIQIPAIASQRAVVIGGPEYSKTTRKILERGAYLVEYDRARQEQVLRQRAIPGWERTVKRGGRSITGSYGLITVLANDTGRPANTISVTGISSAGIQAAMEFFASAASLEQLKREFDKAGFKHFPLAYQVVVRCTAYEDQMLSYHYEAHKVLE